jgi:hypothetical protein
VGAVAVLCAIAVGAAFLLLPQRWALALPAFVLAYFAAATWAIETNSHGGFQKSSIGAVYAGITLPDREWVDNALPDGAEAAYIWTGNADRFTLWANEFFSRKVGTVYSLTEEAAPGGMPYVRAGFATTDGVLRGENTRPVREDYVLTDTSLPLRGRVVARDRNKGMTLVHTRGVVRRTHLTLGIDLDNWIGRNAIYWRYDCRGGTLTFRLENDFRLLRGPQRVAIIMRTGDGPKSRTVVVGPTPRDVRLRLEPAPRTPEDTTDVCDLEFRAARTAVPAAVLGTDDTRELGVRISDFRYRP